MNATAYDPIPNGSVLLLRAPCAFVLEMLECQVSKDGFRMFRFLWAALQAGILTGVVGCNGSDSESTPGGVALGDASSGCTPIPHVPRNAVVEELPGECLARSLFVTDGRVSCNLAEATFGACSCEASLGRVATTADFVENVRTKLRQAGACDGATGIVCADFCIREVVQLDGEDLIRCQTDVSATGPPGFCYVDPAAGAGDAAVVADCPAVSQRKIRVLGEMDASARLFIGCFGS